MTEATTSTSYGASSPRRRQLIFALIAMTAISSPQYVWTLFTRPLQENLHATLPTIQVTFTILVVVQTWLSPAQGWLVDRFGARLLITIGCLLSGLGWIGAAYAGSLTNLYLTYGLLCGIGTGIVYVGIIGLVVRWFPDKRGFATGLVAAGYGFGAILTTFPIDMIMQSSGYKTALITFGIILGLTGAAAGFAMRMPGPDDVLPSSPVSASATNTSPRQMLRSPIFWLMFAMMTMMSTGGLMIISQFAAFSRDFGVADVMLFGVAALPLALTIDRITNGLTRPFFGWVSDRIGRENTMAVAFILEAAAVILLVLSRHDALLFVMLSGLVFLGWGEIFSLFPSTLTDTFGTGFATTNYGLLYVAQGIGSILGGPLAALLHDKAGSWLPVFTIIIAMDALTGLLALFVLKPMRRRVAPAARMPGAERMECLTRSHL
jgi:OFA family oxalate/formate antiporter-like MFS transporter